MNLCVFLYILCGKQLFQLKTIMATTSFAVSDTSKFPSDPSLRRSTGNRLEYLYEISHVQEDSKIPITDLPIVNPYTIFNKPQSSFKKTIKKKKLVLLILLL